MKYTPAPVFAAVISTAALLPRRVFSRLSFTVPSQAIKCKNHGQLGKHSATLIDRQTCYPQNPNEKPRAQEGT